MSRSQRAGLQVTPDFSKKCDFWSQMGPSWEVGCPKPADFGVKTEYFGGSCCYSGAMRSSELFVLAQAQSISPPERVQELIYIINNIIIIINNNMVNSTCGLSRFCVSCPSRSHAGGESLGPKSAMQGLITQISRGLWVLTRCC